MRLPRDLDAEDLIKLLKKYGYVETRQTGSHIRLTKTDENGKHHITVPKHKQIKLGTLNSIVKDVCERNNIDRETFFDS